MAWRGSRAVSAVTSPSRCCWVPGDAPGWAAYPPARPARPPCRSAWRSPTGWATLPPRAAVGGAAVGEWRTSWDDARARGCGRAGSSGDRAWRRLPGERGGAPLGAVHRRPAALSRQRWPRSPEPGTPDRSTGAGWVVASASPEQLVRVADGRISTVPIKGTSPDRGGAAPQREGPGRARDDRRPGAQRPGPGDPGGDGGGRAPLRAVGVGRYLARRLGRDRRAGRRALRPSMCCGRCCPADRSPGRRSTLPAGCSRSSSRWGADRRWARWGSSGLGASTWD